MQVERRAFYNLLRGDWLANPTLPVEPWQVEDYRSLSLEDIFEKLEALSITLDRISFQALADESEAPEELTDQLLNEIQLDPKLHDYLYLLIFELWRRLVPEKLSLSIFCNELDYQITRYEETFITSEELHDILANLVMILNENVDEGVPPQEIFKSLQGGCAHQLEDFLYEFILDQLVSHQEIYASELLDQFSPYISDKKWFDLLQGRLMLAHDPEKSEQLFLKLIKENSKNFEFLFEALNALIDSENIKLFRTNLVALIPLFKEEKDFKDVVNVCIEFFNFLDRNEEENLLHLILQQRMGYPEDQKFQTNDPHLLLLKTLFQIP